MRKGCGLAEVNKKEGGRNGRRERDEELEKSKKKALPRQPRVTACSRGSVETFYKTQGLVHLPILANIAYYCTLEWVLAIDLY